MAFRTDLDRAVETATITGSGSYTLGGAVAGMFSLAAAGMVNGDTAPLIVEAIDANGVPNGGSEIGIYTWNTGPTLSRTKILKSSNANAAVVWGSNTLVRISAAIPSYMLESGATTTSSAVDVTLTAGSNFSQTVAMTADYKAVLMPDATTCLLGQRWRLENSGALIWSAKDNGGTVRAFLMPGQVAELTCTDNSTAAGVWQVANLSPRGSPMPSCWKAGAMTTFAASLATGRGDIDVVALSATKYLVVYNVSNTLRAKVLDIASGVITAGTELNTTFVLLGSSPITISMLDSTHVIAAYVNGTNLSRACVFAISGSTVTVGAEATVTAAATSNSFKVLALSATVALLTYCVTSTTFLSAVILSVSGTTITVNTPVANIGAFSLDAQGGNQLAFLSSTKAFCAFNQSSSNGKAFIIDISGTTPSATGTAVRVEANLNRLVALSATSVLATFMGLQYAVAARYTVTGSNVAADSQDIGDFNYLNYINNSTGYSALVAMSNSRALMLAINAGIANPLPVAAVIDGWSSTPGMTFDSMSSSFGAGLAGVNWIAAAGFDATRAVAVWSGTVSAAGECVVLDLVS